MWEKIKGFFKRFGGAILFVIGLLAGLFGKSLFESGRDDHIRNNRRIDNDKQHLDGIIEDTDDRERRATELSDGSAGRSERVEESLRAGEERTQTDADVLQRQSDLFAELRKRQEQSGS